MRLSTISSSDSVVAVYVGSLVTYPSLNISLSNQYNICFQIIPMLLWSLYAGTAKQKHMCGELVDRFSANSGSLNTDAVFAIIDLLTFEISDSNQ